MTDEQLDFLLRQLRDGERLENVLKNAYDMGHEAGIEDGYEQSAEALKQVEID
jgi:hypothetical protein